MQPSTDNATTRAELRPVYPADYLCSPLTSFYGSWRDIDGNRRIERHTGVDGGRLGEWLLAPAPGRVRAVWRSNWGWGWEGSLLIVHTRADLGMDEGPELYYSALDHLNYDEVKNLRPGEPIKRGQRLGTIQRPGGNPNYLPEVHWEVWGARSDELSWQTNQFGGQTWVNETARLLDPVAMLRTASEGQNSSNRVEVVPYAKCQAEASCRGFTYILPCKPKGASPSN